MKRILLFGFSGFDRFPRNPSQDVVNALAKQRTTGVKIDKVILKVAYEQVEKKIPRLLVQEDYDAVIGFGLARGAVGIRLEKEARNLIQSKTADVEGVRPGRRKIIRGAPDRYRSPVNLTRLRAALIKEDIPAVISHDAGGYVCNFTYYLILHHLRQSGSRAKCLFVHIPLTCEIACRVQEQYPSLPRLTVELAVVTCVEEVLWH